MPATETKIKTPTLHIALREQHSSEVISVESGGKVVSFIACEEVPVERWDWFKGRYYLILSHKPEHVRLDRVKSGACMFLEDHDQWSSDKRIGKILDVDISKKQLIATARLNSLDPGQRFYQEVLDKTEPPKSVGVVIHETEVVETALYEEDEDGYKKLVRPATLRAIDWELTEISSVSVPAVAGAAVKELANEQHYEMLMHGDPGLERLDIPETVVKASAPEPQEQLEAATKAEPEKTPPKPETKKPKGKSTMANTREEFADLEHDALIDRALELKRLTDAQKGDLEELKQQLQQLNRKDAIRDQYFSLRNKAERLLHDGKLTAHEFEQDFTESSVVDVNNLCKKEDAEIELKALERYLTRTEGQAPRLNLEMKTDREPLSAPEAPKPNTPTGQAVEDYAKLMIERAIGK